MNFFFFLVRVKSNTYFYSFLYTINYQEFINLKKNFRFILEIINSSLCRNPTKLLFDRKQECLFEFYFELGHAFKHFAIDFIREFLLYYVLCISPSYPIFSFGNYIYI